MSVDDRLREAFTVAEFEPTGGALELVRQRARRERLRDRGLALAAAAVVAAVLGFSLLGGGQPKTQEPVLPVPTPTQTPVTRVPDELNGLWKTRRITGADLTLTLESAGLGEWSDEVVASLPEGPWRLRLVIEGGDWRLWAEHDGRRDLLDHEIVQATGNTVVSISPKELPYFRTTYATSHNVDPGPEWIRWVFLETTEPVVAGVPAEAHQRALYTTAPFLKVR
ncbi:MAG TPA: hypothetical protein VLI04_12225 [Nocardioidaceae bacterium]|nr:hypothetical protein [Nocardioidaceae bacterium]